MPKKKMAWEKRMDEKAERQKEEDDRRKQQMEFRQQIMYRVGYKKKRKQPKLARKRLSDVLAEGEVLAWKGNFGWIKPAEPLEHELAEKHKGHLYCEVSDIIHSVKDEWGKLELTVGATCQFFIYSDENGLGAEEVIDLDLSKQMLEDERREEEERRQRKKQEEEEWQMQQAQARQAMQAQAAQAWAQRLQGMNLQGGEAGLLVQASLQSQMNSAAALGNADMAAAGIKQQYAQYAQALQAYISQSQGETEIVDPQQGDSLGDTEQQQLEPSAMSGDGQMDGASLLAIMQQYQALTEAGFLAPPSSEAVGEAVVSAPSSEQPPEAEQLTVTLHDTSNG